jgi:hypothetical protein
LLVFVMAGLIALGLWIAGRFRKPVVFEVENRKLEAE